MHMRNSFWSNLFIDLFQVFSLPAPKRNLPRSANLIDPVLACYLRVIPLVLVQVANKIAEVLPPLWETWLNRQGRHLRKKNLARVPKIEPHLLWLEVLPLPRWVIAITDRSSSIFFFFFLLSPLFFLLPFPAFLFKFIEPVSINKNIAVVSFPFFVSHSKCQPITLSTADKKGTIIEQGNVNFF